MRRLAMRLVVLLVVATAGAAGCQDLENPQALFVSANTLVSTRTQCQVRAGATEMRARGIMDVAMTNTYFLYPQIANNLPESDDLTQLTTADLRLNNNNVTILGATVNYDYDVYSDIAANFEVDFEYYQGVFMHASGGITPGEIQPTVVPVIPWEMGNELARAPSLSGLGGAGMEMNLRVVVQGVLSDNTIIRSNEFWYPLTVCNGCLVISPPNVDPRNLSESVVLPCTPGQDDGVDVRLCYAYAGPIPGDPDLLAGDAVEALNKSRDRCRWQHILLGIEPADSRYFWERTRQLYAEPYPDFSGPAGMNGAKWDAYEACKANHEASCE